MRHPASVMDGLSGVPHFTIVQVENKMSTYIAIPREAVEAKLASMGFQKVNTHGREIVYARAHASDPNMEVKVYTSCTETGESARKCGADAIRIFALSHFSVTSPEGKEEKRCKVVYRARVYRVHSVESTLDRVHQKAREGYAALNEHRKFLSARKRR